MDRVFFRKMTFSKNPIMTKAHISSNPCLFPLILFLMLFYRNTFSQKDSIDIYELDFKQLSNIQIISSSKVIQDIVEVPTTIRVITAKEIKENGYFTLEEAVSSLPGFQFRNIQGINSYIFQRGIPNQNNLSLLLIDGVQINELNSGGFYAGGQYNLANVDRIEVVYGPASVAYGTNAVSGIINIITKNPTEGKSDARVSIGNFGTYAGDFNYNYINSNEDFGIRFSGLYKFSNKADLRNAAGDFNWSDRMENFEKDYSFDLKIQKGDFKLGANYIQKQSTTTTMWKSTGTIFLDNGTLWNIRFLNAYLKYDKDISEKITLSSMLYNRNATVLDNSIYQIVDTAQIGYYRPNNLFGFESIFNYEINNIISLTSGITFENERLARNPSFSYSSSPSTKPPLPVAPEMLNNTLFSFFFEPRLIFLERVYLSGGIRFDKSSSYDKVVTPRIGLSYSFGKHVFRLSYAEAFRAPKPWDYTDGIGNPSLEPEKMNSLETSIILSINDNLEVDLTGYKNKLKNGIERENLNSVWRWINRNEINTLGAELMLQYTTRDIKSFFNYTITESKNEAGQYIPEISTHTANSGITYYLNKIIAISLRANYIGERENPRLISTTNDKIIKPALVFHFTVSMLSYKGFDAQIAVKNLFDKEYYHSSNRDVERYRQSQRTIIFTIGYTFFE